MQKNLLSTKTSFKAVMIIIALFTIGMQCQAQAWTWRDMVSWFRNVGYQKLVEYAHPNSPMQSYTIVSTSPNIVVEYVCRGRIQGNYTAKYEIVQSQYAGRPVFSNIRIYSDDALGTSFIVWDRMANASYSRLYREQSGVSSIYGSSYYEDLSLPKRAAFALEYDFLMFWDE